MGYTYIVYTYCLIGHYHRDGITATLKRINNGLVAELEQFYRGHIGTTKNNLINNNQFMTRSKPLPLMNNFTTGT